MFTFNVFFLSPLLFVVCTCHITPESHISSYMLSKFVALYKILTQSFVINGESNRMEKFVEIIMPTRNEYLPCVSYKTCEYLWLDIVWSVNGAFRHMLNRFTVKFVMSLVTWNVFLYMNQYSYITYLMHQIGTVVIVWEMLCLLTTFWRMTYFMMHYIVKIILT